MVSFCNCSTNSYWYNPPTLIFLQFSTVEHFKCAKSLAAELLDIYVTGGVRLALTMVTRIPPMISIVPEKHDPHNTILKSCNESEITTHQSIFRPLRPILYFSYEGEVAVEGEVTIQPSNVCPGKLESVKGDDDRTTGDYILLWHYACIQFQYDSLFSSKIVAVRKRSSSEESPSRR